MMIFRLLAVVSAIFLGAECANATTGAELVQSGEMFGIGFTWGVAEGAIAAPLGDDVSRRLANHRQACLHNSKINRQTFYEAVKAHILANPDELGRSAAIAVFSVVYEMCGPPSEGN
jgi:hypothetical protein